MQVSSITRKFYLNRQTSIYLMSMSYPQTDEDILQYLERSNTVSQPIESEYYVNVHIIDRFNKLRRIQLQNDDDLVLI